MSYKVWMSKHCIHQSTLPLLLTRSNKGRSATLTSLGTCENESKRWSGWTASKGSQTILYATKYHEHKYVPKGPFPLQSQFAKRMRFANSEFKKPANSINTSTLFARISIVYSTNEICLLLIARVVFVYLFRKVVF